MSTQEELTAKRKEMKELSLYIKNFRRVNPEAYYYKAEYTLQEQYNALHKEEERLRYKVYLESCNCQKCEDSGWLMKCCSDERCEFNVICYDCDAHLKNEEED